MKRIARPPIEIFSLSFLDIISCAFGAVVLLVLLSKNADEPPPDPADAAQLIRAVAQGRQAIAAMNTELTARQTELEQAQSKDNTDGRREQSLQAAIPRAQKVLTQLNQRAQSLREEIKRRRAALAAAEESAPDEEVGGIPVDAEYVLFVIDTSGSMQQIWARVMALIEDILANHPKVAGFNFLSDNGEFLYPTFRGRWLADTPKRRRAVLKAIRQHWIADSNSSPVEGLETALRLYGKQDKNMAVYVFGDDYTGNSFDRPIANITQMNRRPRSRKPRMRIHAVAFNNQSNHKYATLMRGITERNGGTFIAPP